MESESEIVGLRKYYNDIITDYNKLVKTSTFKIFILSLYPTKRFPYTAFYSLTDDISLQFAEHAHHFKHTLCHRFKFLTAIDNKSSQN